MTTSTTSTTSGTTSRSDTPTTSDASDTSTSVGDALRHYLDDHRAAGGMGRHVATKLAERHRDEPWGPRLATVASEIAVDDETLHSICRRFDAGGHRLRRLAGVVLGQATRLPVVRHLVFAGPSGEVLEVEALVAAVNAKRGVWMTLSQVAPDAGEPGAPYEGLIERADRQVELLRSVHRDLVGARMG